MPFPFDFTYNLGVYGNIEKEVQNTNFIKNILYPNYPNWKNIFSSGISGILSRMYGAHFNYYIIHAWDDRFPKGLFNIESYVASVLFNLDSALECCVFSLNALGCAIDSNHFYDINNTKELSKINPRNVIGYEPKEGYGRYFPNFLKLWTNNKTLINTIMEHHDVTKHRHFNLGGGSIRSDPPKKYLTKYNVNKSTDLPIDLIPFEKVLLSNNPKLATNERVRCSREELLFLEDLSKRYVDFIKETGNKILSDILIIGKSRSP